MSQGSAQGSWHLSSSPQSQVALPPPRTIHQASLPCPQLTFTSGGRAHEPQPDDHLLGSNFLLGPFPLLPPSYRHPFPILGLRPWHRCSYLGPREGCFMSCFLEAAWPALRAGPKLADGSRKQGSRWPLGQSREETPTPQGAARDAASGRSCTPDKAAQIPSGQVNERRLS